MKLNNIKRISLLLSVGMIISIVVGAIFPMASYAKEESHNIELILQQTSEHMVNNKESFIEAWPIMGLVRSGTKDIDKMTETYVTSLKKELLEKKGVLTKSKYSDYSRAILALTSLGIDPQEIQGYNLLDYLSDLEKITIQGINGPLWALIAIDSHDYEAPISRETLIAYILENEKPGGGWALSSDMTEADVDITAMVLTSLSKYKDRADVKPYIQRALEYLSKAQKPNGGFETLSAINSESSSQVIIALSSLQIDLVKDNRFIKNGNTVIDTLIQNFYNGKGGFYHIENGNVDKIATEQAFMALQAYSRFKENKPALYDMTAIKITIDESLETEAEKFHNPFKDIENDVEKEAIIQLNNKGTIKGMTDTEFMPKKSITRAEFATLLARAFNKEQTQNHGFTDVKAGDWFSGYVGAAKAAGLINGYPNNIFKPNEDISRQEAAMVIYNTAKVMGVNVKMEEVELRNYLSQFPDYIKIADWSRLAMGFAVKNGYIRDEIINIEPLRAATRSEVAGMLYRLLEDM